MDEVDYLRKKPAGHCKEHYCHFYKLDGAGCYKAVDMSLSRLEIG
jgi:hypothetical protein